MTDLTVTRSEVQAFAEAAYQQAFDAAIGAGAGNDDAYAAGVSAYDAVIDAAWEVGA